MPETLPPSPTANKGIPLAVIVDLVANKELNHAQAAKVLGCDKSNVTRRLQAAGLSTDSTALYKKNRADVLAAYQQVVLNSIHADDLKKAGLSQKIMAFGVLYDKERLERGESTQNIAYADMVKAKEMVDREIQEFKTRYKLD